MTNVIVKTTSPRIKSVYADSPLIKTVSFLFASTFMILGLAFIITLFNWGMNNKLNDSTLPPASSITTEMRERQLNCLAKNIYYEAGSEPFEGKVAVAQVTLNRTKSKDFPDDVCRVVYQKNVFYQKVICQFSWYCDHAAVIRPLNEKSYAESMTVAKKVLLEGFELPSIKEALYYHADYVNPGWKKVKLTQIGRHIFYR